MLVGTFDRFSFFFPLLRHLGGKRESTFQVVHMAEGWLTDLTSLGPVKLGRELKVVAALFLALPSIPCL